MNRCEFRISMLIISIILIGLEMIQVIRNNAGLRVRNQDIYGILS